MHTELKLCTISWYDVFSAHLVPFRWPGHISLLPTVYSSYIIINFTTTSGWFTGLYNINGTRNWFLMTPPAYNSDDSILRNSYNRSIEITIHRHTCIVHMYKYLHMYSTYCILLIICGEKFSHYGRLLCNCKLFACEYYESLY